MVKPGNMVGAEAAYTVPLFWLLLAGCNTVRLDGSGDPAGVTSAADNDRETPPDC